MFHESTFRDLECERRVLVPSSKHRGVQNALRSVDFGGNGLADTIPEHSGFRIMGRLDSGAQPGNSMEFDF